MRNSILGGLTAAAACTVFSVAASANGNIAFTKLVDTSFVAPDGQLVFTMDRPQMAGSTVAFIGATSNPDVYLFSVPAGGGAVTALVSNSTKVPDGSGDFTGSLFGYYTAFEPPGCSSPAIGKKSVVFVGRDGAGNEGVYSVPVGGGKVRKLVNYSTPIPGGPVQGNTNFNAEYSFCNVSVSGDTVLFDAGGAGVYQVDTNGRKLARIADPNTPATIHTFDVDQYLQPTISGTHIAYIGATVFGPYAVFDGPPDIAHALVVARKNKFDSLSYPVISATGIDFSAHLAYPNEGIYRAEIGGGKPEKVMDLNTKLPRGTPGTAFVDVGSNADGENWSPDGQLNVVAAATTDGTNVYPGLFSSCKANRLAKILTQGDTLDGVVVGPGAGVSNLVPQKDGTVQGAILVIGGRYAAIYTVALPGC